MVIIISNDTGNIYSEKVNVLPIEGDGTKINPKYQMRLPNSDLESGHLDKDPSRIIFTDIMTIDKARLDIKIGMIKHEKMKEINSNLEGNYTYKALYLSTILSTKWYYNELERHY